MNVAFKHLEAKLRFGDLSIGQWAGVVGGILLGIGFALYLSPFGSLADVIVGRVRRRGSSRRGVLRRPHRVRPVRRRRGVDPVAPR